ncbi:DUF4239 domain-containing protein [Kaistia terrae]|nr:DUF4239 domain-containing protein [Kaistia terrae]MCX5580231.1 DUF4239 domain-containing protein [Kaistia terrae]
MWIRRRLPNHHLDGDAKDVIKLAIAIIGTLSALALGLLISSAKVTYENANTELKTSVARVVLLDRTMAKYGAETQAARHDLRKLIEARLTYAWDPDASEAAERSAPSLEPVEDALRGLVPSTDTERNLQTRALAISWEIAEAYWVQTEAVGGGLPRPFLMVLVFWLAVLFGTFGLLAPTNATVFIILLTCAVSVSAAIYLIVDMDHPYIGFIHVSDAPLRAALVEMGKP